MANYAMHYYEVYAEAATLDQIEKEVRSWEGDISIKRMRREGPLTFEYPMKYIHDFKSFKKLSYKFPNADFHINVNMAEGPQAYYVAQRGGFAIVDIDTKIKEGIHALMAEIYHRDLFNREAFETVILAFEDENIPWWNAAFRIILGLDEREHPSGDARICPECVKKFYKKPKENWVPDKATGTEKAAEVTLEESSEMLKAVVEDYVNNPGSTLRL